MVDAAGARVLGLLATLLAFGGCKGVAEPPDPATSPQAKAEPAPLENATMAPGANGPAVASHDAGPPPEALRIDTALPPDVPRETAHETGGKEPPRDPRELGGYALQAVLRTGEGPPAPRGPEVNLPAIEAARRKTEARLGVELSQTRARYLLTGGFVLPPGAELRARADRYGHFVLLPGEDTYRIAEPGALRGLVGERRLDVAPLSAALLSSYGEGARRLGAATRRIDVSTRAAKASLELGVFRDAGEGGVLLCRLLLDLMSALPSTPVCGSDEIPLHAEIHWMTHGTLVFDVTSMARRADLPVLDLAAPPASVRLTLEPLPLPPADSLVARADLTSFRTGPVDVPPAGGRDAQPPPPESGLLLVNSTDELRVAWLDGVPVAWCAPGGRETLGTLLRGRYTLQWRTFLGDNWDQPSTVVVPGIAEAGGPEPGAR